jgi:hypothetical protein
MEAHIEDRWITATNFAAVVGFAALLAWLIERHASGNRNKSLESEGGESGSKTGKRLRAAATKNEIAVATQFCAHEFYDP